MTSSIGSGAITVQSLALFLDQWPHRGADGLPTLVLLGSPHAALGAAPEPATSAGALEIDDGGRQNLILHPEPATLPTFTSLDMANALDLALAALTYSAATPIDRFDPYRAAELSIRAVTAIQSIQRLERRFSL